MPGAGRVCTLSGWQSEIVADRAAAAYAETVEETTSIQVGTPSDAVLRMLDRQAGAGVPLSVKPHYLGGFTRPHFRNLVT